MPKKHDFQVPQYRWTRIRRVRCRRGWEKSAQENTISRRSSTDHAPPAFTIFPVFLFYSARSLRSFGHAERISFFIRAICEICRQPR